MSEDSSEERTVPMRLQKYLARSGAASRRGSEDLMTAGRVRVNGDIVTELGSRVDPATDIVSVDGRLVTLADGPVYMLLNKPDGHVTTMDDPQGRPTVREFMPHDVPGLFPVGRLDMDTTGVLLLTTDGDLAHRLMHPSFHVAKTYEVEVEGSLTEDTADRLRQGVTLDDGPTKPASVDILSVEDGFSRVRIVISEGRKRQVKRMFVLVGNPVRKLHRSSFGPLDLGDLAEGQTRELSKEEAAELRQAAETGGE